MNGTVNGLSLSRYQQVKEVHAFSPENGVIKPKPVPVVESVRAFCPEWGN